jgi:hypothetical protein
MKPAAFTLVLLFTSAAVAAPMDPVPTVTESPVLGRERVNRLLSVAFPAGMSLSEVRARLKREGFDGDAYDFGDNRPLLLVPVPKRTTRYALQGPERFIVFTFDSRDRLKTVSIFAGG